MNQKSLVVILGVAVVILLGTTIYFATISNVSQPAPAPVAQTPTQPAPTEAPKCHGESYTGDFCGFSPEVSPNRKVEPPKCSVSLPKKPTLRYSRKSNTVVGLTWEENDENTTHWSVSYGLTKDNLPYGVPFLPKDARSIEINGLSASNWWFELTRWNGNECAVYSDRIDP